MRSLAEAKHSSYGTRIEITAASLASFVLQASKLIASSSSTRVDSLWSFWIKQTFRLPSKFPKLLFQENLLDDGDCIKSAGEFDLMPILNCYHFYQTTKQYVQCIHYSGFCFPVV